MLNTENSLSHQSFIQELDGVCSPKWKNVLLKRCFISSLPSQRLLCVLLRTGPGESAVRADTVHILKSLSLAWEPDRSDNHTVRRKNTEGRHASGDWELHWKGPGSVFGVETHLILGT